MFFILLNDSQCDRYDSSQYIAELQAHGNNAHCIASAINVLAGCLFYDMGAEVQRNIENRLTEFLALASSALLKLTHENGDSGSGNNVNSAINRDSVYIILDQVRYLLKDVYLKFLSIFSVN